MSGAPGSRGDGPQVYGAPPPFQQPQVYGAPHQQSGYGQQVGQQTAMADSTYKRTVPVPVGSASASDGSRAWSSSIYGALNAGAGAGSQSQGGQAQAPMNLNNMNSLTSAGGSVSVNPNPMSRQPTQLSSASGSYGGPGMGQQQVQVQGQQHGQGQGQGQPGVPPNKTAGNPATSLLGPVLPSKQPMNQAILNTYGLSENNLVNSSKIQVPVLRLRGLPYR